MNGDGKLDVCVVNGGGVSVLLGNGDGTFQSAGTFAAGVNPNSVAIGDFNGDGKPDLAVANYDNQSRNVSVLLGKGDGTFLPAVNYGVEAGARSVAKGDFNGDGKADLAVVTDVAMTILLGNGDGTFQATVNYGAGYSPNFVALGDFNEDNKPDLAVTDSSGYVSVLLVGGDGTLQAAVNYGVGQSARSVAVADFNGDGWLDLAVGTFGGDSVLLGNGDGTFQAAVNYGAGGKSLVVSDFNGDGKLDLATARSVLLGNGDGTFRIGVSYDPGVDPSSLVVGDFNGDGKPDLAVASTFNSRGSNAVSVLIGNGDGTFQSAVSYGSAPFPGDVATGDFNGDGKLDLVVSNVGTSMDPGTDVWILLGNGDGTFQSDFKFETGVGPGSIAVGDFNADGKTDLAVANSGFWDISSGNTIISNSSVSVLLGNGDGTFQTAVHYDGGISPFSVIVGDFNGDGRQDLSVANMGDVSVLLGVGDGAFEPPVNFSAGSQPFTVAAGDLNRDGKPDVIVANGAWEGSVSVLLNTCGSAGVELAISRSNSSFTISWPFPSTGFVLESTTNLTSTNWQRAVEVTTTNNNRLEVTAPLTQQERYFRLHKP